LISVLITNAIDDLPLPLYRDGSALRDYLYAEDHCRAVDLVLHEAEPGSVYNIGTGRETSGNQAALAVCELLGKPVSLIEYVADRPGHDNRYALDSSRIRRQLGWQPLVDFEEGLEQTVRWYQENEDWWRPLKSGAYWDFYRTNYRSTEIETVDSNAVAQRNR
jgi:dTDP-glucose 4,6-dehydratase